MEKTFLKKVSISSNSRRIFIYVIRREYCGGGGVYRFVWSTAEQQDVVCLFAFRMEGLGMLHFLLLLLQLRTFVSFVLQLPLFEFNSSHNSRNSEFGKIPNLQKFPKFQNFRKNKSDKKFGIFKRFRIFKEFKIFKKITVILIFPLIYPLLFDYCKELLN